MAREELVIQSRIDGEAFSEFARFDLLRVQKRWKRPAVFAAFFTLLALLAFSRAGKVEHAALLGGVLLAVGLGLPLVYFASFARSVRRRARQQDPKAIAYTLTLTPAGVAVKKGTQTAEYAWEQLYRACRLERSVALYVDPAHALLLTGSRTAAAWEIITRRLPAEKREDRPGPAGRPHGGERPEG